MALFNGVFGTNTQDETQAVSLKQLDSLDLFVDPERDSMLGNSAVPLDYDTAGQFVSHNQAIIDRTDDGVFDHLFGDDCLFHRFWFTPVEVDAGFIVETVEYTVSMWNAYFDQTITVTNIVGSATTGTLLEYDATPFVINKFWEKTATLTVYAIGPPTQSTTYTFTIGGEDYVLEITGIRVNMIQLLPQWGARPKFEMVFETALVNNRRFAEQRRPLRPKAFRKSTLRFVGHGQEAQRLKQKIIYGHDKVFGVPILHEQSFLSVDPQGGSTITTTNTLTNFWHLNNQANYIVLIDQSQWLSEIKEIQSVGSTTITLTNDVVDSFDPGQTLVYPIYLGILETVDSIYETDGVYEANTKFAELVTGS